jgi:hypothetical protein
MGGYDDQSVYCETSESRGTILNPPAWEPVIEEVAKYGMRKSLVKIVL